MRNEFAYAGCVIAMTVLTFSAAVPAQSPGSAFPGYQPYREQPLKPWKDANQEVADNPGMGSMPGMGGHNMAAPDSKGGAAGHDMSSMPGMGAKAGSAQKPQAAAAGHDMSSMPGMGAKAGAPQKSQTASAGHDMGSMKGMPGMAPKTATAPKPHADDGHAHDKGSMQAMPGMTSKSGSSPPATADPKAGHDMGAMKSMPGMASKTAATPDGPLTGTGVVRGVDKANGKVRLTHDPIEAMGWPKLTLIFRLKDNALADGVADGDRVEFSLEKSATGYVISDLRKSAK